MSKNTNLSFLTDYITADITNGRIGINNASPAVAFDVTGVAKFSSSVTSIGNGTTSALYSNNNGSGAQYYQDFGNGAGFVAGRILRGNGASGFAANGLNIVSYDSLQLSANATGGSGGSINLLGGNVGIGTTSPAGKLNVSGPSGSYTSLLNGTDLVINVSGSNTDAALIFASGTTYKSFIYANAAGAMECTATTNIAFGAGGSEKMRITTGGDLYFGSTTITTANTSIYFEKAGGDIIQVFPYSSGSSVLQYYYRQNGSQVGSISYNGTNTLFNGTSDYRLKEDLKEYNALNIISKLKTYDFKWKETGIRDYGMIAHELQEVLPNYVTGNKDAINDDGTIKTQGVDYSKIVPVLVKAIQELSAEITILKNK